MTIKFYEMTIAIGPQKGEMMEAKFGCECEDIKLANEALKARDSLKVKRMLEIFEKHSLINRDLQQASSESYNAGNESQEKAKRISERLIEVFTKDKPINLLFSGPYGVGKSHLAKSIVDGVIDKGFSGIFISVPKLLTKFRTSYNKDSDYSEGDLIEILNKTDVLVLDDLGAEKSSEWAWEKLFEIIDSRQGMSTVYTSNYNPDGLQERLGERNFSRIVNRDTTVIEMQGSNFRLGKFAQ